MFTAFLLSAARPRRLNDITVSDDEAFRESSFNPSDDAASRFVGRDVRLYTFGTSIVLRPDSGGVPPGRGEKPRGAPPELRGRRPWARACLPPARWTGLRALRRAEPE